MKYNLKKILFSLPQIIIDFFLPDKCINCNLDLLKDEFFVCENCLSQIKYHSNKEPFFFALYSYEDLLIKKMIRMLKYDNRKEIGYVLGRKLGESYKKIINYDNYYIIYVPLHQKREKKRGYNQAYLIALGFSEYFKNSEIINNLIIRQKNNVSQTKLHKNQRSDNVKNIFQINSSLNLDKNRCILIIDDLITTGSTVKEIIKTLNSGGYHSCFSLSIASPPNKDITDDDI